MFRYSKDEFIASKQREAALILLEDVTKHSILEHSPKIEVLFDDYVKSIEFIEELVKISGKNNHPITIPVIPWNSSDWQAKRDLKTAYDKTGRSWQDTIPFIEFSFPEDYCNPHGPNYTHVYLTFFTPFKSFDGAEECTIYYLNKLSKLKAFI